MNECIRIFTLAKNRRHFQIEIGHFGESDPKNDRRNFRFVERKKKTFDEPNAIARRWRNIDLEEKVPDKETNRTFYRH